MQTKRTIEIAALALLLAGGGCRKDEPAPEPAPEKPVAVETAPVKRRMQDPEYVGRLRQRVEDRKPLLKAIDEVERRLAKAKEAATPDPETLAALEAERAKAVKALERFEVESRKMVARQIRGDLEQHKNLKQQTKEN